MYIHYFLTNAELIESVIEQENQMVPCGRKTLPKELCLNSDFYKLLNFAISRELNRGLLTIAVKHIYQKNSSAEDFKRKIKLEENGTKTVLNT